VKTSELFRVHHHLAAPFPRDALTEAWRRCGAGDAEQRARCAADRGEFERTLGPLSPEGA